MRLFAADLACRRGGREVFHGIGFELDAADAQFLLVTGPNGAGKSSLLRIIAGLLRPAAGRLDLQGGDSELSIAEQAHYVGHSDAIKPALTVLENLAFWTRYLGPASMTVKAALVSVGLDSVADVPAAYLSAGQKRRLSMARLLTVERPIWLLDEPNSNLDLSGQQTLETIMHQHRSRGGMIVMASHANEGIASARELRLGQGT